jgi:hypothetical protein
MNTKKGVHCAGRSEPKKIADIWKHCIKNAHKRQFLSDSTKSTVIINVLVISAAVSDHYHTLVWNRYTVLQL